jgi:predicted TIM-barrel fold metal-dependent hydrolase
MQEQFPSLPAVEVPPELAALLRLRERIAGGAPSGEKLGDQVYTDDVQALDITDHPYLRWVTGRDAAMGIAAAYGTGTRLVPHAYGVDGATGYVNGVMRTGARSDDETYFTFGLRRIGGQWRIATEDVRIQPPLPYATPMTAQRIVAALDDAGIRRAVVLSTAFWLGRYSGPVDEEYAKVRAEHDWTVEQVARYPDRLVAFCGVNPLKPYAIRELERCATLPNVKGMKLHLGNSRLDVTRPEHLQKLRDFVRAANARRMAIVAHLWIGGGSYGRRHSEILLDSVLPLATDITVQIAHLGGGGSYANDDAVEVFANAAARGDPRMKNVYFDLATVVDEQQSDETVALVAKRIRQIGPARILFGADAPILDRPPPVQAWATFRRRIPLTIEELRTIASNVAPYLR